MTFAIVKGEAAKPFALDDLPIRTTEVISNK
jgi:hypothetical protein